jgi:hypothetical protein
LGYVLSTSNSNVCSAILKYQATYYIPLKNQLLENNSVLVSITYFVRFISILTILP